jgi:4-amino-4-deoxy-L-arabinose transferase-like glycosyltransferase
MHRTMAPLVLFVVALACRVIVGALHGDPAYPDSFYYANVARELAAGNGFQVGYIWNFVDVGGTLPADPVLPIPSNAHWLPLAALVQVPFIWLLGPTGLAAGLPFWIIGALAAPLAYLVALDAGLGRGIAFSAGLLTAAPAALTPFMAQPDNFGLYMTLGASALWLSARAWRGDWRALALAGLVVGLATLARNDGLLLAVPLALAALVGFRRGGAARHMLAGAAAAAGLFALTLGPWLLRQLLTFGSVSPSTASGRILWINDYDEMWSVTDPPTAADLLAAGVGPLLSSRIDGIVDTLTIFSVAPLAAVLVPFALIGAWLKRRHPAFIPFYVYATLLFASSALLFSVHVPYGMFMHSLVALLPHTYVLVGVGVVAATEWAASRRRGWQVVQARRVFLTGTVVLVLAVAGLQTLATVAAWRDNDQPRRQLSDEMAALPADDRLMAADPGAYTYHYRRAGVVTPNDPLPVVEQVARAYGVRWLVLERGGVVPALQPVLLGMEHPAWLSRPVAQVPADDPWEPPLAALYAVCLEPTDTRCQP